ncbi:MAG: hypothetical protein R3C05_12005 [Pirellulaceae bacterium]
MVLDVDLFYHFGDPSLQQQQLLRLRNVDPFVHVQNLLQESGLAVYDPLGNVEAAFEKLSLRPTFVTSLRDVRSESLVLIGEATVWDRRLIASINELAAEGKWVIVLRADTDSKFPMNLSGGGHRLSFSHLSQSDWSPKKLDTAFWPKHHEAAPGLQLFVEKNELFISPQIGPQVWQLAEYHLKEHRGGLLFIGVPVIHRWNASPVPRVLLSHALVHARKLASAGESSLNIKE